MFKPGDYFIFDSGTSKFVGYLECYTNMEDFRVRLVKYLDNSNLTNAVKPGHYFTMSTLHFMYMSKFINFKTKLKELL